MLGGRRLREWLETNGTTRFGAEDVGGRLGFDRLRDLREVKVETVDYRFVPQAEIEKATSLLIRCGLKESEALALIRDPEVAEWKRDTEPDENGRFRFFVYLETERLADGLWRCLHDLGVPPSFYLKEPAD